MPQDPDRPSSEGLEGRIPRPPPKYRFLSWDAVVMGAVLTVLMMRKKR